MQHEANHQHSLFCFWLLPPLIEFISEWELSKFPGFLCFLWAIANVIIQGNSCNTPQFQVSRKKIVILGMGTCATVCARWCFGTSGLLSHRRVRDRAVDMRTERREEGAWYKMFHSWCQNAFSFFKATTATLKSSAITPASYFQYQRVH